MRRDNRKIADEIDCLCGECVYCEAAAALRGLADENERLRTSEPAEEHIRQLDHHIGVIEAENRQLREALAGRTVSCAGCEDAYRRGYAAGSGETQP